VTDAPLEVIPCLGIRRVGRPLLRFVQWAGALVAGWTLLGGILGMAPTVIAIAAALGAFPLALFYAARWRTGGDVRLEEGGLAWRRQGEVSFLSTAEIQGGHLARKFRAPVRGTAPGPSPLAARSVILQLANGAECWLDFEDQAAAEKVLAHAGLDAGKRAVVAPLRGMLGAFTRGLLAFLVSLTIFTVLFGMLSRGGMVWAAMLAAVSFTAIWVRLYGYPRVVVGTDGIRLIGRLVPRFVSFGELRGAAFTQSTAHGNYLMPGVRLTFKDGRTLLLPTIAQSGDAEQALVRRIQAGMDAYAREGKDRVLNALERGGRPVAEWKAELLRVAQKEAGFRDQAFGPEDFERVLSDPRAGADRRLGAAIALRGLDENAGPRIREAAATSANVKLRVALEKAAEGEVDEEALADALEAQRG
jgi:hypothetical protein